MPDQKIVLNQYQGLNRDGSQYNMSMTWLWDLLNGYIERTEQGRDVIVQREGTTKISNSDVAGTDGRQITAMFEAIWNNLNTEIYFGTKEGIYYLDGSDNPVLVYDSVDNDQVPADFSMFNDSLVVVAPDFTIKKIDSAHTVTALSSDGNEPTSIVACHTHNHRLVLADSSFKVYMSRVDDATSSTAWSANNDFVEVDLTKVVNKTDKVVNFATLGESLLVIFCVNVTIIYNVPTTYEGISLQQVIPVGLIAKHAFGVLGSDIIFPSKEGLKLLTAAQVSQKLDVNDLTRNIGSLYRTLVQTTTSKDFTFLVSGSVYNKLNQYLVSFTGAEGESNQTLVYSFQHNNFVGRYQFNEDVSSWLEATDGTLYYGTTEGRVYKLDDTTNVDEGEYANHAINFRVEYPYFGSDLSFTNKSIKALRALIETNQDTTIFTKYRNDFAGEEVKNSQVISANTIADPSSLAIAIATTTTLNVTADSVFIDGEQHENVDVTIDIDAVGANGIDRSGLKQAGHVYTVYLIYDIVNDTVAGLLSQDRFNTFYNRPEQLPSGYSKFRYIGTATTDGSSQWTSTSVITSSRVFFDQGVDAPTLMEDDSAIGRGNQIGIKIEHATSGSRVKIHSVQIQATSEAEK